MPTTFIQKKKWIERKIFLTISKIDALNNTYVYSCQSFLLDKKLFCKLLYIMQMNGGAD